jgi:hypothetical protein
MFFPLIDNTIIVITNSFTQLLHMRLERVLNYNPMDGLYVTIDKYRQLIISSPQSTSSQLSFHFSDSSNITGEQDKQTDRQPLLLYRSKQSL